MKILLMGDASNYHRTLSGALLRAGHDVTVASDGSRWMGTGRDIDLSRRQGKLGGALLWTRLNTLLRNKITGYDVVQIHNPVFLELQPHRVREIFDRLRRGNGGVFLTALGTDTPYVEMCLDPDSQLRYNEYMVGQQPTANRPGCEPWLRNPLRDHCRYIYDNIDGAVSALYEYHLACRRVLDADRIAYGGIPIAPLNPSPPTPNSKLQTPNSTPDSKLQTPNSKLSIMLACHKGREAYKGVDVMWPRIQRVADADSESVEARWVQNVPFAEFERILSEANVVVDQLYSYTPATTALMAMAQGKIAVTGGEEDFYRFIGENELRPVINPDPTDPDRLVTDLQRLVGNPELMRSLSDQGRRFVEKHNSADVVARRFIDFWERRLACR